MPQPSATNALGSRFVELQSVESTNNYAREQIKATRLPDRQPSELHGTAFFAHEQVAGKGQRNKVWTSEKGTNIILSVVINPDPLPLTAQFRLSACVAVAVQEFFSRYAGDNTKIKWPNDLYWQDRKAGGILIENIVRSPQPATSSQEQGIKSQDNSGWDWSITGIGININQVVFAGHLPNPVSLKQITGKNFDPVALAKELCYILDKNFRELTINGFNNIYRQYLAHLYKLNEPVRFKKDNRVFEATPVSVTPFGKLVVRHAIEEEFDFGEIEWLI